MKTLGLLCVLFSACAVDALPPEAEDVEALDEELRVQCNVKLEFQRHILSGKDGFFTDKQCTVSDHSLQQPPHPTIDIDCAKPLSPWYYSFSGGGYYYSLGSPVYMDVDVYRVRKTGGKYTFYGRGKCSCDSRPYCTFPNLTLN